MHGITDRCVSSDMPTNLFLELFAQIDPSRGQPLCLLHLQSFEYAVVEFVETRLRDLDQLKVEHFFAFQRDSFGEYHVCIPTDLLEKSVVRHRVTWSCHDIAPFYGLFYAKSMY